MLSHTGKKGRAENERERTGNCLLLRTRTALGSGGSSRVSVDDSERPSNSRAASQIVKPSFPAGPTPSNTSCVNVRTQ